MQALRSMTHQPRYDLTQADQWEAVKALVLNALDSDHSRRAYSQALDDFFAWYTERGRPGLSKAAVQAYRAHLQEQDLAPATINQRLSAIRKLAREAADNGAMPPQLADAVNKVKGVKTSGRRMGNWLTRDQAQALLGAPDTTTLRGVRDQALLAILLGGGLRRAEASRLQLEEIQQREGRWVIVDIVGKRNRTRSVPIASWVKYAVDRWCEVAGIEEGAVFRAMRKGGHVHERAMTPQAIYNAVRKYADELGFEALAVHDLRRTFAHLARKGETPIEQIQLSLGHASIKTTEDYLGIQQDLHDAPSDRLGIRL